jgi:hypothetical protein
MTQAVISSYGTGTSEFTIDGDSDGNYSVVNVNVNYVNNQVAICDKIELVTSAAPPEQATSPSPANSATGVSITTDLSWTAGSGATSRDVYFGTTSPGTSQGNQTATTFDTGTMSNNTTYYWRIDEINAGGTTTGTVWSFTTIVAAPSAASSPSPSNSATGVSITADLSWTAGSGSTSSDVYFGTDSTPDSGELQGNQTATTFDTGTMANNTTYYWRINEVNAGGTTIGTVWSFTTIVAAPGAASTPSPANSAADVSITADLSWSAGSDATSHDVYFGTDSTPDSGELQGNQTATTFDTGTMSNNTTYYWRIDQVNAAATTTGTVWSFTTIVAASVPGQATSPSPANSAANVSITADLSWTEGSESTSSDVYFGTDSTPDSSELQGNQTATTFEPGTLNNDTTYYWRIDEINAQGTTTGVVWSFTTQSAAGGTVLLVDFGDTAAENTFELTDWDTAITDTYTNNVDIGPGGTTITVGNNEGYDYQGVTGTSRNFVIDEKIVATWYNNSASQVTFTPRMSFTDSDRPDASWYSMTQAVISSYGTGTSEFTIDGDSDGNYSVVASWYSMTQAVISSYGTGTSEFTIDGDSDGNYSVVNVNVYYSNNEVAICDKIELVTDAAPPEQASSPNPANSNKPRCIFWHIQSGNLSG